MSKNKKKAAATYWCIDSRFIESGKEEASASAGADGEDYLIERDNGVAVMHIYGGLAHTSSFGWFSSNIGYDRIAADLKDLADDPAVRGIIIDFDCPGGAVAGVQECADVIASVAAKKPCCAFTSSLCASAAYWLASATSKVFATETAEVGSIGVVTTLVDQSKALENMGIKVNVLQSGAYKTAGSSYKELTDKERAYIQSQLDSIHEIFRTSVASHMGIEAPVEEWGDAQIFLGRDALQHGLVSQIVSGIDEAKALILRSATMTREELQASSPELLEALVAEGVAKGKAEAPSVSDVLAMVKPFVGEAVSARISEFVAKCEATGMTMAQMTAMADMMAEPAKAEAEEAEKRESLKAEILDSLRAATPAAVPSAAKQQEKTLGDYLMAAAERLGKE